MLTFIAMPTRFKADEPSARFVGMPRLPADIPPMWLTDATAATATASIRRRRLPAEQAIWLVVALALYRHQSASEVVDALDIALPAKDGAFVSKSAITQARQRVGGAPLKWLFTRSACEWANESKVQSTFKGFALFAMDGTTVRTADSHCNREHFGSQLSGSGRVGSYPQARAVTLSSIDTHIVRDAEIGPYGRNEMLTARQLVPRIPDRSITVFDKGFMSAQILWSLSASGVSRHFIIPAKSNTRWQHIEGTSDDQLVLLKVSQPARRANPGMPEHWHARAIRTTDAKGRERILLTSLTDRRRFQPDDIASTYRRRWQVETSYLQLKATMSGAALTLRSQTVECVYQEFWGALIAYNLVRIAMSRIARGADVSPHRLSFVRSYHAMQLEFLRVATNGEKDYLPALIVRLATRIARLPHQVRPGRTRPRVVRSRPFRYRLKKLRIGQPARSPPTLET
ncbi:IS4 family transposase [Paraburkholderia strydomiana]|nr:IS4 family transposase [Paraburkholderia strydomiana]